jgi:predicted ester cyclase
MTDTRKEKIVKVFNELRADNLSILDKFYHPDIHFIDPVGEIKGLKELKEYYANMYQNVQEISFDFEKLVEQEDDIASFWTMNLKAKSLNKGQRVKVKGTSRIAFDNSTGLVIMHRDYFDMGEFIYEYIPLLKTIIKTIKKKIGH